jgi:hypothetical protein
MEGMVASYSEQLETIESYGLRREERIRSDCPWCDGVKTLSISRERGALMWHCFRSNCIAKGRANEGYTLADVKASMAEEREAELRPFVIPEYWTYLTQYVQGPNYFDPKLNRDVYLITKDGETYDAIGRSINRAIHPKWHRYGNTDLPYHLRHNGQVHMERDKRDHIVMVEDCLSACACFPLLDSMAILGTVLRKSHISLLVEYEEVIIALDPDAKEKALIIWSELSTYVPARLVNIPDDLKYLTTIQIEEVLCLK